MASPFDVFRRNQRLGMTILAIGAMVLFSLDWAFLKSGGSGGSYTDNAVAVKTSVRNLTRSELVELVRRRQLANRFIGQAFFVARSQDGKGINPFEQQAAERLMFSFGSPNIEQDVVFGFTLSEEGKKLGMVIDDARISAYIEQLTDRKLTSVQFQEIVAELGVSGKNLYEVLRGELLARDVANLLAPAAPRTPLDYWKFYRRLNARQKIELVSIPVEQFTSTVGEPTQQQIDELFAAHKDKYPTVKAGVPEPGFKQPARARLQYLQASFEAAEHQVSQKNPVTDAEVLAYYEANKDLEFRERVIPQDPLDKTDKSDEPVTPEVTPEGADKDKSEGPDKGTPAKPDAPKSEEPQAEKPTDPKSKDKPAAEDKSAGEDKPAAKADKSDKPAEPKKADPEKADPAKADPEKKEADKKESAPAADKDKPEGSQSSAFPKTKSLSGQNGVFRLVSATAEEKPAEEKTTEEKPAEEKSVEEKPAAAKAAEDKPADKPAAPAAKPADEKPPGDKPADDKPVAEEKPASEKPATEKPASDKPAADMPAATGPQLGAPPKADEAPVKYKPLDDDLKAIIRDRLVSQRARTVIAQQIDKGAEEMQKLGLELIRQFDFTKLTAEQSAELRKQAASRLAEIAKASGLTYVETPLVSSTELQDLVGIGKSSEQTDESVFTRTAPETISEMVFSNEQTRLVARSVDPETNDRFVFWKIEYSEPHVPVLTEEGVNEQVVKAWKEQQARPKALARAEELAKKIREDGKTMTEALGETTVTGAKEGLQVTVHASPEFTWIRETTVPGPFGSRPAPALSTLPFADRIGERFMKVVFEDLSPGEVGVASNVDQTTYFVVKVIERTFEPVSARETFLKTPLFGNSMMINLGLLTSYDQLSMNAESQSRYEFFDQLRKRYAIEFTEQPREQDEE